MKKQNYMIYISLLIISVCQAQEDVINTDYMIFGRKEPASSGSIFSALGNEPIFFNPASVAFITDTDLKMALARACGTIYCFSTSTLPNLIVIKTGRNRRRYSAS